MYANVSYLKGTYY